MYLIFLSNKFFHKLNYKQYSVQENMPGNVGI